MKDMLMYFVIGVGMCWFYFFIKSLMDPDVRNASNLRMTVKRYKLYEEIFNEQMECHKNNKKIPNRMDEIPNMNEWQRYGKWRLEKARGEIQKKIKF